MWRSRCHATCTFDQADDGNPLGNLDSAAEGIHEGILQSPHANHSFVNAGLETIQVSPRVHVQRGSSSARRPDVGYVWKTPGVGVVKIHVDGGLSRMETRELHRQFVKTTRLSLWFLGNGVQQHP